MRIAFVIIALVVFIGLIVLNQTLFSVDETEQGIITQLGVYVRSIKEPGLNLKVPFIQTFDSYDKRVLVSEASSTEYLTTDKKRLVVDSYTRWRIADPFRFFKTVRTEAGARARLDGIILSELRRELAVHTFKEAIGLQREAIMETVARRGFEPAAEFGIQIIDVRIKRADLPQEVQQSVFKRMEAERQRIAKRYRAEGEEQARRIRAEADKEVTIITAEAFRKSKELRGAGDAEAIKIYAQAYEKDAEFYAFVRSLEAYEKFLGAESTLILDANSELFRYLAGSGGTAQVKK